MRLIDADKLERTDGLFTYKFTDDLDIMSCCAYRYEDIETAPTVEAIPVEWLETYIDEHWSDECYLDGVGRTLEKVIARWRTECEK